MKPRTTADGDAPFATIAAAARRTGLSQYYLRERARSGSIPVLRSGTAYMICIPKLLEQLEREVLEHAGQ